MDTAQLSSLTTEEANLLYRSTQKPKTEGNKLDPKVSFTDRVIENQLFESLEFDFDMFANLSLEDDDDNPTNHPTFIPISSAEKQRLYKSLDPSTNYQAHS